MNITISLETWHFILSLLKYAYDIFLWGFLYFAVFNHLIRNRDYKIPCPKIHERETLYWSSVMMCLWMTTTFVMLGLDIVLPFTIE